MSEKSEGKVFIAEVPLLFEKKLSSIFDGVILVAAKKEVAISRIMKKYGLGKADSLKRL